LTQPSPDTTGSNFLRIFGLFSIKHIGHIHTALLMLLYHQLHSSALLNLSAVKTGTNMIAIDNISVIV